MMIRLPLLIRSTFGLAAAIAMAGCAARTTPVASATPASGGAVEMLPEDKVPTDWHSVIKPDDQTRIERTTEAWTDALAEARAAGFGKQIASEAELLDPAVALPRAAPPPGPYLCRVIKLGSQDKHPAYESFKAFNCYVEAEGMLLTLVKQTGSQRPAGRLWSDDDSRLVFLGALGLGDAEPPAYGDDPTLDIAGWVQRVAPFRWRLVAPWPRRDSKLDVIELVPFAPAPVPAAAPVTG